MTIPTSTSRVRCHLRGSPPPSSVFLPPPARSPFPLSPLLPVSFASSRSHPALSSYIMTRNPYNSLEDTDAHPKKSTIRRFLPFSSSRPSSVAAPTSSSKPPHRPASTPMPTPAHRERRKPAPLDSGDEYSSDEEAKKRGEYRLQLGGSEVGGNGTMMERGRGGQLRYAPRPEGRRHFDSGSESSEGEESKEGEGEGGAHSGNELRRRRLEAHTPGRRGCVSSRFSSFSFPSLFVHRFLPSNTELTIACSTLRDHRPTIHRPSSTPSPLASSSSRRRQSDEKKRPKGLRQLLSSVRLAPSTVPSRADWD
jgi:hypothetical protein